MKSWVHARLAKGASIASPGSYWLFAAVALAGISATHGLSVVLRASSHLPFQDQWQFLHTLAEQGGSFGWDALWAPHNEHRIVLPRLLFLADVWLDGARSDGIVVLHAMLIAGFGVALARCAGLPRLSAGLFTAFCLGLLLSAADSIPIVEPFNIAYTLVLIGAAASVRCSESARLARLPGGRELAAILCAILATLSSANGLLLWPLLVVLAILRGHGARAALAYGLAGLAVACAYFWDYPLLPREGGQLVGALHAPFAVLRFVTLFLAGPVGQVNAELGRVWGALLIGAAFVLAWRCWRAGRDAKPWSSGRVTLLAIALFLIGCGLAAAAARFQTTPRPPRYSLMALTFTLSLAGLWAGETRPLWRAVQPATIFGMIAAGTIAATIAYAPRQASEADQRHALLEAAADALRLDIRSDAATDALAAIAPDAAKVWSSRAFLRDRRLTIFADGR